MQIRTTTSKHYRQLSTENIIELEARNTMLMLPDNLKEVAHRQCGYTCVFVGKLSAPETCNRDSLRVQSSAKLLLSAPRREGFAKAQ